MVLLSAALYVAVVGLDILHLNISVAAAVVVAPPASAAASAFYVGQQQQRRWPGGVLGFVGDRLLLLLLYFAFWLLCESVKPV